MSNAQCYYRKKVNIKNYRIPDQNVYNGRTAKTASIFFILYINFVDKYVEDHFIGLATTRYNAIPI